MKTSLLKFFLIIFFSLICLFILTPDNNLNAQIVAWHSISGGTNGTVYASAVYGGDLYIAGDFTMAGTTAVNRIARWNGTSWFAVGSGLNDVVYALTVYNNQLIAGGKFTTAGGNPANKIASWSMTAANWTTLGLGTNDDVFALAVYNADLRVGGKFTTAGGVTVNRVARWNGTSWYAMGAGTNDEVNAFTIFGSDLIVGGKFTTAGGSIGCRRIARWNNTTWLALASGIDSGQVFALGVHGGFLYVGGDLHWLGGVPINNLVRWNGTSWASAGSGTNGIVNALHPSVTNGSAYIYLGGSFTTAGGITVNGIASFNGTVFGTCSTGVAGNLAAVYKIIDYSSVLCAAGSFITAGNVTVNNVGLYGFAPPAPNLISPLNASTGQSLTPLLVWSTSNTASSYGVQLGTDPNFATTLINVSGITLTQYQVTTALPNATTVFWRANARNGIGTSPWSSIWYFTTLIVGINVNTSEIPKEFKVYQNYPNPFNPTTKIKFDIPESKNAESIDLTIYDASGKEINQVWHNEYKPGVYELTLDGSKLSSGIYFYKISVGDFSATNKMVLIK